MIIMYNCGTAFNLFMRFRPTSIWYWYRKRRDNIAPPYKGVLKFEKLTCYATSLIYYTKMKLRIGEELKT